MTFSSSSGLLPAIGRDGDLLLGMPVRVRKNVPKEQRGADRGADDRTDRGPAAPKRDTAEYDNEIVNKRSAASSRYESDRSPPRGRRDESRSPPRGRSDESRTPPRGRREEGRRDYHDSSRSERRYDDAKTREHRVDSREESSGRYDRRRYE